MNAMTKLNNCNCENVLFENVAVESGYWTIQQTCSNKRIEVKWGVSIVFHFVNGVHLCEHSYL